MAEMKNSLKVMRDALIEQIIKKMDENNDVFFVSADFGSPKLDILREKHGDRFVNVGIAEQNLINISTGLALEGYVVFSYLIAPFLMRAYEQIRINLAMLEQIRPLNVNIIGVGAGLSYDVTGPTHHCLEDISIMRTLPNIEVFSPSDGVLAAKFIDYSINTKKPKYIRLDGKPVPDIYDEKSVINIGDGFYELKRGLNTCIISTGYMTGKALNISGQIKASVDVGVIDMFMLKSFDESKLKRALAGYKTIITLEEAFVGKSGLDCLINNHTKKHKISADIISLGFEDKYIFEVGGREFLHKHCGLDNKNIINLIEKQEGK